VPEERIRKVEKLPHLEERVRSVRPMEEADLRDDEIEVPVVAANSGNETVPYGPAAPPNGGVDVPSTEVQRSTGDATVSYSSRAPNAKHKGLTI